MADSALAVTGGNVDTRTVSNGDHRQVMAVGDGSTDMVCVVDAEGYQWIRAAIRPAVLTVVATSTATASAATLTLPAVAAQFHHICELEITLYSSLARTGSGTPWTVTTTNLFGLAWTFETAGVLGTAVFREMGGGIPQRSQVAGTATTVACPAATGGRWTIRARYYASV